MKIRKFLFSVFFPLAFIAMSLNTVGNSINTGNEIAYLHTDRDIYIAGENIFFKLYLIDAGSHKLSGISKIAYLVLRNNVNIPIVRIKLKAEGGTAYGSIFLPDSLKSGPYQLTVFTNWMRNAGEGSFFTKEIFIANRFDKDLTALTTLSGLLNQGNDSVSNLSVNLPLKITTDKTEYNKREKINLSLNFSPNLLTDSANLSISVSEDVPGISNYSSIGNYLILNLVNFSPQQSNAGINYRFLPELKGEIIQGKVIDLDSKDAVADYYVFLSATDTLVNLQYDVTDTSGMFRFLLNDYYYDKDLYFSIKDISAGRRLKIIPEDKFELKNDFEAPQYHENQFVKEFILKSQDIVTIQKTYDVTAVREINNHSKPNFSCPQLYYKPSYRIFPADFVPLNDFAEISKEILPPQFNLKKHNDLYTANMADENQHQYMDQQTVIFLDGVYIDNINQLIKLGSDKVKRIELVSTRFNCGELIFPGILAVFSKNNEIKNIQPNSSSLRIQLETYHPYSGFTNQSYAKEIPGNQPDFRQLLYWNPALEIYSGISLVPGFYASDHSGNYTIRIEGITSGGVPVSVRTRIKVK
jgi:hypothetical protein